MDLNNYKPAIPVVTEKAIESLVIEYHAQYLKYLRNEDPSIYEKVQGIKYCMIQLGYTRDQMRILSNDAIHKYMKKPSL